MIVVASPLLAHASPYCLYDRVNDWRGPGIVTGFDSENKTVDVQFTDNTGSTTYKIPLNQLPKNTNPAKGFKVGMGVERKNYSNARGVIVDMHANHTFDVMMIEPNTIASTATTTTYNLPESELVKSVNCMD